MKVTVAIPTIAGRTKYLASALATCTAEPDANLEILVSDNSAGDAEAVVRATGDARVRYIRPPQFLTMAAHWEFLLGHVGGEAVTIIGDDDGLMPGAVAEVGAIHRQHGNVLIHHAYCNYWWPDHPDVAMRNAVVFLHDHAAGGTWRDSSAYLTGVAAGRERYLDGPMIYHNFVPMPLLRRMAESGPVFRRAIPDVYSALALTANAERFFSSGQFLTIGGQGAKSNGALVGQGSSDGSTFAAAPASDDLLSPRSRSRAVSSLLTDAMLEVAAQYGRAEVDARAIDWSYFLEDALLEASMMRGTAAKQREFAAIAGLAIRHGATAGTLRRAAVRVAAKAAKLARLMPRRRNTGPGKDMPTLRFGPEIVDIASAARATAAYLDTRDAGRAA